MLFKKNTRLLLLALVLGMLGLYGGMAVYRQTAVRRIDLSQFHGTLMQKPRPIHAFSLRGIDKKTFNNNSLQGKWTMLFFGFTHCNAVCPVTLAQLRAMHKILEKQSVDLPQVVMVTLDPEEDTLDTLATYVHSFHPNFYAARGKESQLSAMTHELGIAYERIATPNAEGSTIEHTGAVMLFNPQGKLHAFFTMPHKAALLAQDYLLLASH